MENQLPVKRPNEMAVVQQELYKDLANVIENWAKKHSQDNADGVRQIFEVCVTLTLAVKALYALKVVVKGVKNDDKPQA